MGMAWVVDGDGGLSTYHTILTIGGLVDRCRLSMEEGNGGKSHENGGKASLWR